MRVIDSDAVIWSTPEAERPGRPLLVLLHGYGSHEGDLFGLSPQLPLELTIASLRAPRREGPGYAWFSLDGAVPGAPVPERVDPAADAVLAWVAANRGEASSVGLLGFSQGGAIALEALRRDPDAIDYVVNLAGFAATAEQPGDAVLAERRPPVFYGRGLADPVIPAAAIDRTLDFLPGHSALVLGAYEQLGHGVSPQELADVVSFLRDRLADARRD